MDIVKEMNCNAFFSGGGGMFIQYHDVIKPVYLYTIVKMLITGESYGLPLFIIKNMNKLSLVEWYIKRRYINPLKQLDFQNVIDESDLNNLLKNILKNDESIYKLAPTMNIQIMIDVAKQQHMSFPLYIYSEEYDPFIESDCKKIMKGFSFIYVYGDLEQSLKKCDQNFTYIFSNIELAKNASKILTGQCSHIVIANDYRYNYMDNMKTLKYNLSELSKEYPYVRMGTFSVMNIDSIAKSLIALK